MQTNFQHTYIKVNVLLAAIIVIIFIYFGIFSDAGITHPVQCIYKKTLAIDCPGCGLSRSFSEAIRFNFEKANTYNTSGLPIFLFFVIQLFLRIIFSLFFLFSKQPKVIITSDVIISVLLFACCFGAVILKSVEFFQLVLIK